MAKEYLRCRCPFCGMMPYVEDVLKTEEPANLEIYRMSFGGTRPLDDDERLARLINGRKRRGSGRGIINYDVITDEVSNITAQLKENFQKKFSKFR